MARFERASPALKEILLRLYRDERAIDADHHLHEFGSIEYYIQSLVSDPDHTYLSIATPILSQAFLVSTRLSRYTIQKVKAISAEVVEIVEPPKEGYQLTIRLNFGRMPHGKAPSSSFTTSKKETSYFAIFGRGRYKFWAFAAISLLALWSMFTGTVTLRWSAGNLNAISDDIDIPLPEDLDVLEMEEREKLVKHMWDVYTNSRGIKLLKFWQEAFEAAYEELASDVPGVPEDALSEIAKMSVRYIPIESPPLHSSGIRELSLRQMKREQTTATGRKL